MRVEVRNEIINRLGNYWHYSAQPMMIADAIEAAFDDLDKTSFNERMAIRDYMKTLSGSLAEHIAGDLGLARPEDRCNATERCNAYVAFSLEMGAGPGKQVLLWQKKKYCLFCGGKL